MDDASQHDEEQPKYRVTALVVSLNNAEALRRCLTALGKSTNRESLEIIVVDKGSRDDCPTMDSEFPNITMLRMPRNFGTTKALNIGMRTAVGELMFFLVPEVEVHPDTIAKLVAKLDSDPDAVAVCPVLDADQFYRLPTTDRGAVLEPVDVDADAGEIAVEGANFTAMLASKYYIRGINFLDEKYGETFSDADLCFQIRRSGKKVVAMPQIACGFTPRPDRFPDGALKVLEADRTAGAIRYFKKYYGLVPSLLFRIKTVFKLLFSLRLGLLVAIVAGRKVDGTQREL
jgi:N-acetylglucosaminyl-diphospho-decaprenol L-rhamnosyltransferase